MAPHSMEACAAWICVWFDTWKSSRWNVVRHVAKYIAIPGLIIYGNSLKEKQGNFAWSKKQWSMNWRVALQLNLYV